ncbi:MAG TPA: hypothetical protein VLA51_11170, partial [Paracoccaceae bacterium]|nr:hypothetical protein [Paracoccaceae bacterium]
KLPLGVIEALQGRIAALKAMSQADSAITPDVLKAYKEELESAVNSACSPEGKSKARQLGNKLVPNIDKLLNADVVIQFPPDGIGAIRERWHEVRADLLVSEPASGLDRAKEIMLLARDAHERAQALSERHAHVAALVVDLQKNFENSGTFIDGMQKGDAFFELVMNTEKLKKRLGALKTEIEAMPDPKRAEDLKKFNRAEKYLLGINQKMKADRGSTGHAPTEYYGPLRGELMEVRAMLANHDQTSIQAASDRFEEIRKEYVETTNSAGQSLRTPGAELDFILGYASSVSKSFIKKEEIEEKQKDFEQLAKDLKSAKSTVTKKETSKTAKALIISAEEQISGLRRSVENRQIEYSEAIEQAKALLERIKALSLDEKPEVSAKTKVAKSFQGLQSKCHQLADSAVKVLTSIRAKASVEDLKHYKDNIEHTEEVFADLAETWGKNGKILDALAELCDDENNELNSPGRFAISDVRRVREEALAALHRVLARAEADVGLRHYRANPVDAGQQFLILRGAFHELEIELLKSVDPRRKS